VEGFILMNRGINNGGDIPRELLISLYNSIQAEPFKIPPDDGNDLMHTFFNPDKEGTTHACDSIEFILPPSICDSLIIIISNCM